MHQTIADIPTPEGQLHVERVVLDLPEDAPPGVIVIDSMVVSVGAYLDNHLISCERAEALLSAALTAERNDGADYRVTISKRNGSLSSTPSVG